jgi:hypothetical protein
MAVVALAGGQHDHAKAEALDPGGLRLAQKLDLAPVE